MMLDVGRDVLVMRVGAGEFGDMGVLKMIVPNNLLASLVDLVTIVENASSLKVNEFPDVQDHITFEGHLSFELGQRGPDGSQNQRGALDDRITLLERVDELCIGPEI